MNSFASSSDAVLILINIYGAEEEWSGLTFCEAQGSKAKAWLVWIEFIY